MENLLALLRPILRKRIEEAMNDTTLCTTTERFPWLGDNCYLIMADAVICVLRAMQDSQDYMRREEKNESKNN